MSSIPVPAIAGIPQATVSKIHDYLTKTLKSSEQPVAKKASPFWAGLRKQGSELWLDTGDMDAASELWNEEFTALTTNNTLLNNEIQKGIYDKVIAESAALVKDLTPQQKILEIAFILNAHHGLRLVSRFGAKVSVELHTDLSYDIERAVFYGKRYYNICPSHFIVKVPLTPAGLISTRKLREAGIPVNFTLGFSARHNFLATHVAKPSFVNVFLGRINAYFKDNNLGDGKLVGEKAMIASQHGIREASKARGGEPTRHIAASLRDAGQIAALGGVDVFTMPTKAASQAVKELTVASWANHLADNYPVTLNPGIDAKAHGVEKVWAIRDSDRALAAALAKAVPQTGDDIVKAAIATGNPDLFPTLTAAESGFIASDGKIPKHARWEADIAKGRLAIDTLLNLAGLASFTGDQKQLDDRIAGLIK